MRNNISRRMFAAQSGAAVFGLSAFSGIAAKQAKPLSDKFLRHLPKLMEWAAVPGVQVAVVEKERVVWKSEFGVMNAETKEPVSPETVFPAASLSKPVFAYAILKLSEDGILDLDRPLVNYLPVDYIPDPRGKTVTARHVLSHSSGLQNWRFEANDKLQLAFAPGEKFSYSGEGFFYLQRVAEKLTGQGLEQFMSERVFQPFGMKQSSFFWRPEYEKSMTKGHTSRGQMRPAFAADVAPKVQELAAKWNKPLGTWQYEDMERALQTLDPKLPVFPNFMPMNAAASLQTTVTEYSQFLIRLLNPPAGDKFMLKSQTLKEMLKPNSKINDALGWGLGIGLENQGPNSCFWHWGDNGNFKNFVIGNPTKSWGMTIFTNGRNGHKIWERIIREATNQDYASFLWV